MTREEFSRYLIAAANPDTAAEALTQINDGVTSLFDGQAASETRITDLTNQVNNLRDTNTRLFLRITGAQGEGEQDKDPEAENLKAVEAAILEKFGGKENG